MKYAIRKSIAVFFSVIMIVAVINFALVLNTEEVSAANVDTCGLTNNGDYCVEVSNGQGWDAYGGCAGGHEWNFQTKGEINECQKGACVPSDVGGCLDNVEEVRCKTDGGTFHLGASKESVSACQSGCCIQFGSCSVQEEKVCRTDLGGEQFIGGITNRQDCNLECSGSVTGCYKSAGGGVCEYGPLDRFKDAPGFERANFFESTLCSEVVGCPSYREGHKFKSCGDGTTDDDKWDVYYYDSDGNREEIFDECRPGGMCDDPDNVVGGEDAVCLSTDCVEDSPNTWPNTFKSGESICMNVLSGHFLNDRKSTGLHNYVLTCQNREIEPDYDDKNRGMRCEESVTKIGNLTRVEADLVDNAWEKCHKDCGDGRSVIDFFNYAPGVGQFLANVVGKQCTDDNGWFNNQDKCSDFGNCGGGPLMQEEGYDRDVWAPIGSCNALYPPGEGAEGYGDSGNRCSQCGKGGDGSVNVCTDFECNALGDCQFEADGFSTAGLATTGAIAVGTMGSMIAVCGVVAALPGVGFPGWAACASGVVGGFMSLGAVIYWGVLSIVYGYTAATGTHDTPKDAGDLYYNDKLRLSYILSWANHLDKILSEEEKNEIFEASGIDSDRKFPNSFYYSAAANVLTIVFSKIAPNMISPLVKFNLQVTQSVEGVAYTLEGGEVSSGGLFGKISSQAVSKILIIASYIASIYTVTTSFKTGECIPEKPYTDNIHCAECGLEGQWDCTEKRCKILGAESDWCSYVPFEENGVVGGLCLPSEPDDHSSPYLESIEIEFKGEDNLTIQEFKGEGRKLEISDKIEWETSYTLLKINTSEIGHCKYSFARSTEYDDMTSFPWGASADHGVNITFRAEDKVRDKTYIYIKCQDIAGNTNKEDKDYVSFSFKEAPDELPPIIDYINPVNINVPEGTTNIPFILYAYDKNNVQDCKYSKDNDTLNYGDMTSFGGKGNTPCSQTDETCQKFQTEFNLGEAGWCEEINIPEGNGITKPFNSTFCPLWIKCGDVPDIGEESNVMEDPYLWTAMIWPTFEMDIIEPNATFETYDDKFEIEIETGNDAICKYQIGDNWYNVTTLFSRTHKTLHEDIEGTPEGLHYPVLYECTDFAGNVVQEERTIVIFKDLDAPILLRVWTTSQQLHVLMNEESVCKYSSEKDNFDVQDENEDTVFTMISARNEKEHYASLGEDVYYIKCLDKWDNKNTNPFTVYPR
ncbi:MAG: hypothetical protein ABIH25_01895 [Candidatus Woesearchaeota archaeon]